MEMESLKIVKNDHNSNKKNLRHFVILKMDSEYQRDGRLMDMIDEKWRSDQLPKEDIQVPQTVRPEPEQDNGPSMETLQEQEQKWSDLALSTLNNAPPTSTQS